MAERREETMKSLRASARASVLPRFLDLPRPTTGRGSSVIAALRKRRTVRSLSEKPLSLQALSNLLWSACGVNRKNGPFGAAGRTAASASNAQEIDIYVALKQGVFLYEAQAHRLALVLSEDVRPLAIGQGQKGAGAAAPVRLIYVADVEKLRTAGFQEPGLHDRETQKAYYYVDTGIIAGNVSLFAASQGLAAWFHNCSRAKLSEKLKLRKSQRVLFGHSLGYPRKVT
jgi:nitroreductase